MTVKKYGLNGLSTNLELGKSGLRIKSDGTLIAAKNNADDALVRFQAATATANDDVVNKAQMDTALGNKQNTLTVAASSANYLQISGDEISVKNLLITDVTVDVTYTTLALFVASEYTVGTEFQKGDVIILTAATDQQERSYIHNGGTSISTADFTRLQTDLNETVIKGMFSAGTGLSYSDGVFSLDSIEGTEVSIDDTGWTIISGATAQAVLASVESSFVGVQGVFDTIQGIVGVGEGTDMGTFTGDIISDNTTIKIALQELETAVEAVEDKSRKKSFGFGDGASFNIGSAIPNGSYISKVTVKVTTIFDNSATLAIGKSGDTDMLMGTSEVDLLTTGTYVVDILEVLGSETQILGTVTGTPTAGAGYILIEYC